MKSLKFIKPNFNSEWEEAIRYPEFKEMGKEAWVKIAKNGHIKNYDEIKDVLSNVDLDFNNLEEPKKERFKQAITNLKMEIPIAVKFSDDDYDLVAGNTRLSGLVNNKIIKFPIWVVDITKRTTLTEDKLYNNNVITPLLKKIGDSSDETLNKIAILGLFRNAPEFSDVQQIQSKEQLDTIFKTWYDSTIKKMVTIPDFIDNLSLAEQYLNAYIKNIKSLDKNAKPFSLKKAEASLIDVVNGNNWIESSAIKQNVDIYNPADEDIAFSGSEVVILDTNTKAKCVIYGEGESWCITKPELNYYNTYRLSYGATPIFVLQRNEASPLHKIVIMNYSGEYAIADQSNSGDRAGGQEDAMSWSEIEQELPHLEGLEEYFEYREVTEDEKIYQNLLDSEYLGDDLMGYINEKIVGLTVNGSQVTSEDFIRDYAASMKTFTEIQLRSLDEPTTNSLIEAGYFMSRGNKQTNVLSDKQKGRVIRIKLQNDIDLSFNELLMLPKKHQDEYLLEISRYSIAKLIKRSPELDVITFLLKNEAYMSVIDFTHTIQILSSSSNPEEVFNYLIKMGKPIDFRKLGANNLKFLISDSKSPIKIIKLLLSDDEFVGDLSPDKTAILLLGRKHWEGGEDEIIDALLKSPLFVGKLVYKQINMLFAATSNIDNVIDVLFNNEHFVNNLVREQSNIGAIMDNSSNPDKHVNVFLGNDELMGNIKNPTINYLLKKLDDPDRVIKFLLNHQGFMGHPYKPSILLIHTKKLVDYIIYKVKEDIDGYDLFFEVGVKNLIEKSTNQEYTINHLSKNTNFLYQMKSEGDLNPLLYNSKNPAKILANIRNTKGNERFQTNIDKHNYLELIRKAKNLDEILEIFHERTQNRARIRDFNFEGFMSYMFGDSKEPDKLFYHFIKNEGFREAITKDNIGDILGSVENPAKILPQLPKEVFNAYLHTFDFRGDDIRGLLRASPNPIEVFSLLGDTGREYMDSLESRDIIELLRKDLKNTPDVLKLLGGKWVEFLNNITPGDITSFLSRANDQDRVLELLGDKGKAYMVNDFRGEIHRLRYDNSSHSMREFIKKYEKIYKRKDMNENKLKGGKADNISKKDIADKFKVALSKITHELDMGTKVEMEHVNSKTKAKEIAMDHLVEIPDYYTRLKKMEKDGKKVWSKPKGGDTLKEYFSRVIREQIELTTTDETAVSTDYDIKHNNRSAGILTLSTHNSSLPDDAIELVLIQINEKYRGLKLGYEVVKQIWKHNPDINKIYLMPTSQSRGFWDKMGAKRLNDTYSIISKGHS